MPRSIQTAPADLAALVCASAASAALGLVALPPMVGAGLAVAWSVAAVPRVGLPALWAGLPALALIPGGGWVALAGWTAAGLAAAVGFAEVA
ncbi:MAG: hypothetical protein H0V44_17830, partial [Planctomycetes bacterium]|nr:hypothetical protein [Planctomycetota bacterium]